MKTLATLIIFTSLQLSLAQAQHGAETPEKAIHEIFDALSNGSIEKMERVVTPDIRILEHGVVWTMDSIRFYLSQTRPQDFKRVNTFDFFQTEVKDQMAFVSYHNRADIHANGKDRSIKWLESAVLVKDKNRWKVKMLHSTRLE